MHVKITNNYQKGNGQMLWTSNKNNNNGFQINGGKGIRYAIAYEKQTSIPINLFLIESLHNSWKFITKVLYVNID